MRRSDLFLNHWVQFNVMVLCNYNWVIALRPENAPTGMDVIEFLFRDLGNKVR